MNPPPAVPGRRKWPPRLLKAFAGLLVFGIFLSFLYLAVLPRVATRWLERELTVRTGAPARTLVEAIGPRRTRLGETRLAPDPVDLAFDRLLLEYTWRGLREERLDAVFLDGLTLRADTDALWAAWLAREVEIPPDIDLEPLPSPPPVADEEDVVLLPPPLPDPAWLWETPLLLSALQDLPVGRATLSRSLLELRRAGHTAAYAFDARHESANGATTSRFQLEGPGLRLDLTARTTAVDRSGFLGFSGALTDLLPVLKALAPADSPLHPARWQGQADRWKLPLLQWDVAVETRDDLLAAAGLLIETGPLRYVAHDLEIDWENAVLGAQLGASSIDHLRFGLGAARLRQAAGHLRLEPSTLHYLRADDLLEWTLPGVILDWPGLATGDLAFRLATRPRYEWWTSPLDGRLVARNLSIQGQPLEDFALDFAQDGGPLTARSTRLRSGANPRLALDNLRLEAWDPFLDSRRVLFQGTLFDDLLRAPLATLQGQLETPANGLRLNFDLLGPAGEALGGGTYRRGQDGHEALQTDLATSGTLLARWAALHDQAAPLRDLAGSVRLHLDGTRAGDLLSARGTAGLTLDDVGFTWDDDIRVQGLTGGLALRWIGLPQTDEPQALAIRALRLGDFPLEDIRLRVHWPIIHRFEIQEFSLRLLDGGARLEPLRFNPLGGFQFDAVLILENIDAAAVTALFPDERYAVTGRLTGRLPVRFENGRLYPRPGFLELSANQPAKLQILGEDLLNDILAFREIPRVPVRERLKSSLREGMPLRSLRIDLFDAERTGFPAVIRFHGSIRTPDIVADDIQLRLNYNLEGIDWQGDLRWLLDFIDQFR
ncbi:MAG: YdbH domain-containing protein [Opitutales bacterium]|nr:YdbH domain-containing protein [Opitutales bacterium]